MVKSKRLIGLVLTIVLLSGCRVWTVADEDDVPLARLMAFRELEHLPAGGFAALLCDYDSNWAGTLYVRPAGASAQNHSVCDGPTSMTVGPDGKIYLVRNPYVSGSYRVEVERIETDGSRTLLSGFDVQGSYPMHTGRVAVAPNGTVYIGYRPNLAGSIAIHRLEPGTYMYRPVKVPGTDGFGAGQFEMSDDETITTVSGHRVVERAPDGTVTVLAGTGVGSNSGDGGPAVDADVIVYGFDFTPDGSLLIASGDRVRQVTDGVITTVAGGGENTADGAPMWQADLGAVTAVASDSVEGCLWVATGVAGGRVAHIGGQWCPAYPG